MRLITQVLEGELLVDQKGISNIKISEQSRTIVRDMENLFVQFRSELGISPDKHYHLQTKEEDEYLREKFYTCTAWVEAVQELFLEANKWPITLTFDQIERDALLVPWWSEWLLGARMPWRRKLSTRGYGRLPTQILDRCTIEPVEWMPVHSTTNMLNSRCPNLWGGISAIVVAGVAQTADGKIIFGVRQGYVDSGEVSILPTGFVEWGTFNNSLLSELKGKVGLGPECLANEPRLVGIFENDQRHVVVYLLELTLPYDEVKKLQTPSKDAAKTKELLSWDLKNINQEWRRISPFGRAALTIAGPHLSDQSAILAKVEDLFS